MSRFGVSASGANTEPLGVRRKDKKDDLDMDDAFSEASQHNNGSRVESPTTGYSDRKTADNDTSSNNNDNKEYSRERHRRVGSTENPDNNAGADDKEVSRERRRRRDSPRRSRDRDKHHHKSSRHHEKKSKRSRSRSRERRRHSRSRSRERKHDKRSRDRYDDVPRKSRQNHDDYDTRRRDYSPKDVFGPTLPPRSPAGVAMVNAGYNSTDNSLDYGHANYLGQPGTPGSEAGSSDSGRNKKRKSRWGKETEKSFIPGMPTMLPANLSEEQRTAYLLQLQIEDTTRKLRTGDYGIPANPEQRSPSPEPVYDSHGKRLNTREVRVRAALETKRHSLIVEMQKFNPNYKPPPDYKAPTTRLNQKVWIPQENHPEINFVGLLIGPRGITLKQLETETGARIIIRGKGSVKEGKISKRDGPLPGEDEPLHAYITATDPAAIDRAVKKVEDTIRQALEVPDGQNDFRKEQLRQLALMNGTLRPEDMALSLNRCSNCGANTHKSWECPDKPNVTANIYCTSCGAAGHIGKDCKNPRPGLGAGGFGTALDDEYSALMAELGEGGNAGGGANAGSGSGPRPILRVNLAVRPRPPPLMSMPVGAPNAGGAPMPPPWMGMPPMAPPMWGGWPPAPGGMGQMPTGNMAPVGMTPPPPPPTTSTSTANSCDATTENQAENERSSTDGSSLPPPPPPPMPMPPMMGGPWPPMPMMPPFAMFPGSLAPPPPPPPPSTTQNNGNGSMPPPPPPIFN